MGLGRYPELSLVDARKKHLKPAFLLLRAKTQKGPIPRRGVFKCMPNFYKCSRSDDNKAHRDHFHLDTGIGVGCLPDWAKKIKKLAYEHCEK